MNTISGSPSGSVFFGDGRKSTFVSYSLIDVEDDGKFSISRKILERSSKNDKSFIAHGKHGVER